MTKQMLIYEKAVPVSSQRHRDWSVKTGQDYSFARNVNAVPLTAVEFPTTAAEYAIVFTGKDDNVVPAVIMGVRNDENLYMDKDGTWKAKYVPAFVRRYPFVFSSRDEGKNFILCIDEEYDGCNQEGRGERLFDADGKRTSYLDNVLEFLKQYQAQFQRTQAFCKKLQDLDVLEPMQAQINITGGQRLNLAGFLAVNREKLKALDAGKLADLAKTDELELIYLHLHSMRNFRAMGERLRDADGGDDDGQGEAAPEGEPVGSSSA